MGRVAIILVFGLAVAFGIISWSLSRSNILTVETTMGYYKYSTARNIARSAINLALRGIDDTTFLHNKVTDSFQRNLMGGQCQVSGQKILPDTLILNASGFYADTTYRIRTVLQSFPKPFPGISAAVGLQVNNVIFDMVGNPTINGNNHDINGNLITPSDSTNNKPGVEVMAGNPDSNTVAPDANKIFGSPSKIRVNSNMPNPADFVAEYIANADYVYGAGTYASNMTWGSASSPVIVYANPGSSSTKFAGSITGWGILVVSGSLEISGKFRFYGLVIPFSHTEINFAATTGTPQIIGAVLMGGAPNSKFYMKGTGDIKYSAAAIEQAKMIDKLLAYRIISWYE
ncbi:MAG: hypothetical protein QME25_07750 [Bacteroidota bacterium]|nr:hypothetical protein [Bacteroidota bacterium]